jgi:hypothetical protein
VSWPITAVMTPPTACWSNFKIQQVI